MRQDRRETKQIREMTRGTTDAEPGEKDSPPTSLQPVRLTPWPPRGEGTAGCGDTRLPARFKTEL